jgi:Helix-turn-helix
MPSVISRTWALALNQAIASASALLSVFLKFLSAHSRTRKGADMLGAQLSDKSLFRLVRAAEQLSHESEPVAAVNARWLQKLREFLALVGSQNKLAKLLGVTRPYLGRVLRGEKPITAGMIERLGLADILPFP